MSNVLEYVAPRNAHLAAYLDAGLALDDPELDSELSAVTIDNGCSHTYVILGTGAELLAFAERLRAQAERIIEAETPLPPSA